VRLHTYFDSRCRRAAVSKLWTETYDTLRELEDALKPHGEGDHHDSCRAYILRTTRCAQRIV
jgi:hypothetical protein